MVVHVEAADGVDTGRAQTAGAGALADRIKGTIGVSAKVTVNPTGGVVRSQGKAVRVIDHRTGP